LRNCVDQIFTGSICIDRDRELSVVLDQRLGQLHLQAYLSGNAQLGSGLEFVKRVLLEVPVQKK
jgi:hypothetical protein